MSDDKTEAPTEHKLRKAREQGQVAKSQDLTTAISLLGVLGALRLSADACYARMRLIMSTALEIGNGDLPTVELCRRMGTMLFEGLLLIAPLVAAAALFAIIGTAAQIGLQVSMEVVSPKPEKVDPAAGLKRLFSPKSLMMFVQMVLKAVILSVVLWKLIISLLPMLGGSTYQSVQGIGAISWTAVTTVLTIALGLFIVLGPIDYAIQRFQFIKGQRMSKDEVKREYKGQEGDPEIKAKRKQIAQEDAQSAPRKPVASANAVIVNPTHYAVAIRYRAEELGLPVVIAKGMDAEALAIRHGAEQAGVPVFTNPPLARALHAVPTDHPIPEELFEPVAAVLRWVDEIGWQRDATASQRH